MKGDCDRTRSVRARAAAGRGPVVRGPRNGDWVRARVDTRDPTFVVGVLVLRHVPRLNYVQVCVEAGERSHFVDPGSIEVLKPRLLSLEELEEGDPVTYDAGWRRFVDLDDAIAQGLVGAVREREGGTWADMVAQLDRTVAPLLAAGWSGFHIDREESDVYGDSVTFELDRDRDEPIQIELYEYGRILVWRAEPSADPDNPDPPLFAIDETTHTARVEAFRRAGWLRRTSGSDH